MEIQTVYEKEDTINIRTVHTAMVPGVRHSPRHHSQRQAQARGQTQHPLRGQAPGVGHTFRSPRPPMYFLLIQICGTALRSPASLATAVCISDGSASWTFEETLLSITSISTHAHNTKVMLAVVISAKTKRVLTAVHTRVKHATINTTGTNVSSTSARCRLYSEYMHSRADGAMAMALQGLAVTANKFIRTDQHRHRSTYHT